MKLCLKKNLLLILILILVTVVFFYFGRAKAGFFIDEIHTYGLSNSHFAPYLSDVAGGSLEDTVLSRQQLLDYATVDNNEIFDFSSVYYNQVKDVHPPLYYFLFNIASSLVENTFTKWTGLVLGYVLYIATLLLFYRLSLELFEGNKSASLCAVALYGLSTIGISTAVFIRMYTLLSFFTVLLCYFSLKLVKKEEYKYCIYIGISIALGMLTQYYFVFYAFFLCLAMCIFFAVKKKWDILWRFALSALCGVALMLVAFPASVNHIFVGNGKVVGGVSIIEAIKDTSLYGTRLNNYMHFVTYGLKASIVCAVLAIVVFRNIKIKNTIILLAVPAVISWAVIAIVSPIYEERYIYNLAPVFVLLASWFIKDDLRSLPVVVIVSIVCLFISKPNNLFSSYIEYDKALEPYTESPCVYLQDNRFEGLTYDFEQLLMFDEVYATSSTEKASEYIKDSEYAVVFIDEDEFWSSGFDPDVLLPELTEESGFDGYSQLFSNGFSGVYLMIKGAS